MSDRGVETEKELPGESVDMIRYKTYGQLEKEVEAHRKSLDRFLTVVCPTGYGDMKAEEAFETALACVIADREVRTEVERLKRENEALRDSHAHHGATLHDIEVHGSGIPTGRLQVSQKVWHATEDILIAHRAAQAVLEGKHE